MSLGARRMSLTLSLAALAFGAIAVGEVRADDRGCYSGGRGYYSRGYSYGYGGGYYRPRPCYSGGYYGYRSYYYSRGYSCAPRYYDCGPRYGGFSVGFSYSRGDCYTPRRSRCGW